MSVSIRLYRQAKKTNSTAVPAAADIVATLTGDIKTPFDMLRPVVVLEDYKISSVSVFTGSAPVNYVQMYIDANSQNRYYWITNIVWLSNSLLELHLNEDVLGTWRTGIRGSTQYILRSTYSYSGNIVDNFYPLTAEADLDSDDLSGSVPWYISGTPSLSNGWYVVGIVNKDAAAYGPVAYYVFPEATFQALRNKLLSDTTWTGMLFGDISEPLYKSLFNPMQYISSVMWFPIEPPHENTGSLGVDIGWWPITFGSNLKCYKMDGFVKTNSFSLSSHQHPQASSRGSWLNTAPYRVRTLYIEPFGSVPIDTTVMANTTYQVPTVYWWVDFVTGKAKLRITLVNGFVVGEAEAMMGVDITIAQITQDVMGIVGGAMQAVQGLGNAAVGAVIQSPGMVAQGAGGMSTGIMNSISATAPAVSSKGTNGSILAFGVKPVDITTYYYVSTDDNTDFGRPYCSTSMLSGVPGFVKCLNPHVTFSGPTLEERNIIESNLSNGCFIA